MKKFIVFIIAVAAFFAATASAAEKKCSSAKDAESYWKFNMPAEAFECVDKLIAEKPADAHLHFLKGKYCLEKENKECAKERFSAAPVKVKYGDEIAELYKARGHAEVFSRDIQQAEAEYREAISYRPELSGAIAESLFQLGKNTGRDDVFFLAARINPALQPAIAKHYDSLSRNAKTHEAMVDNLGKAAEYDEKYSGEYHENKQGLGRFHLDEAKKWARKVGKEDVTNEHRILARKYLGDAAVEVELPEVIELKPRTDVYEFELDKGEQTSSWMWGERGVITSLHFFHSNNKYEIRFKKGDVVKIWAGEEMPKEIYDQFKIIATDNTVVMIDVKKNK